MRILCKFLPKSCDQLEHFIAPICYAPMDTDRRGIEWKNARYKLIQDAKRKLLAIILRTYEIRLQEYDEHYQRVLIQLESLLLNNKSMNGVSLLRDINEYMTCRTHQLTVDVSTKMTTFRRQLLQLRKTISRNKPTVGVSPEPYMDVIENPFNTHEWNQLLLGKTLTFDHDIMHDSVRLIRVRFYSSESKCHTAEEAASYSDQTATQRDLHSSWTAPFRTSQYPENSTHFQAIFYTSSHSSRPLLFDSVILWRSHSSTNTSTLGSIDSW